MQINPLNQTLIPTLLQILVTLNDEEKRYLKVAEKLAQINLDNEIALATLYQILETAQDEWLRLRASEILVQIDPVNEMAIAILYQNQILVTIEDESRRLKGSEKLVQIDSQTTPAIFYQLIETNCDEAIRLIASQTLLKIAPSNQLAIANLLQILATSESIGLEAANTLLKIDPDNKVAIAILSQILETTQNEQTSFSVAEIMLKIDEYRQKGLDVFVGVIKATEDRGILWCATESIGRLYSNNKIPKPLLDRAIFSLVESFQSYKDDYYESLLLSISDRLTQILPSDYLPKIVITLKHCLSEQFYKSSSYRYEAAFNLLWHCAEKMNYPAFYKAWHN